MRSRFWEVYARTGNLVESLILARVRIYRDNIRQFMTFLGHPNRDAFGLGYPIGCPRNVRSMASGCNSFRYPTDVLLGPQRIFVRPSWKPSNIRTQGFLRMSLICPQQTFMGPVWVHRTATNFGRNRRPSFRTCYV